MTVTTYRRDHAGNLELFSVRSFWWSEPGVVSPYGLAWAEFMRKAGFYVEVER